MLGITTVIVDYTFKMHFNFLYFTGRAPPPNVTGPGVTYPLLSISMGLGALIMH